MSRPSSLLAHAYRRSWASRERAVHTRDGRSSATSADFRFMTSQRISATRCFGGRHGSEAPGEAPDLDVARLARRGTLADAFISVAQARRQGVDDLRDVGETVRGAE